MEQTLSAEDQAELQSILAGVERQQKLADDLAETMPTVDSITRYIIAGDLLSAERAMAMVQSGEWDAERALDLTGSYARLNFALELNERGYLTEAALLAALPHLWRGSDPDDTDPRFLALWRKAFNANGRSPVRDGRPLPPGKVLVVFRGQAAGEPYGIAWSLDPKVAQKFARTLGGRTTRQGGVVYHGWVMRPNIMAYLTGRQEAEVIVDPAHVMASR